MPPSSPTTTATSAAAHATTDAPAPTTFSAGGGAIEIREHRPGEDLGPFLAVAHRVYGGDPNWVPPLEMDLKDRLTPGKNPLFEHAKATLFTAFRDGQPVGRCSAQVDYEHLARWKDDAGFFGFFDTVDDEDVARSLLFRAEAWLKERGMKVIRGPLSFNSNEEIGLLVDGFDEPPVLLMNYAKPYQGRLIEAAGFDKAKDLFAWKFESSKGIPPRAERAYENIRALPEVHIRSVRTRQLESDVRIILDIFNDAWRDNWGFVPATESEAAKFAADMKLIMDPEMIFIAEIDERPVGICVCLPNINEAIADLGGKLFPFNIAKLLWRVKVDRPKSARLIMLGVRKDMQRVKRYGGLSTALYVELARRGAERGYEWGELSYTLEDNHLINLGIKAMGARHYKTYRVYEKPIV
jgi:hypothetical protein